MCANNKLPSKSPDQLRNFETPFSGMAESRNLKFGFQAGLLEVQA